jgi:hypothetical protein
VCWVECGHRRKLRWDGIVYNMYIIVTYSAGTSIAFCMSVFIK